MAGDLDMLTGEIRLEAVSRGVYWGEESGGGGGSGRLGTWPKAEEHYGKQGVRLAGDAGRPE
jgi:hypothetical protein